MKIYVSGPMKGLPEKNRPAFEECATVLTQLGFNPVTPFDLNVVEPAEYHDWVGNMKRDVKYVPSFDAFCMLDGWEKSKGARIEVMLAYYLEIPIYKLNAEGQLTPVYVGVDLIVGEISASEFLTNEVMPQFSN